MHLFSFDVIPKPGRAVLLGLCEYLSMYGTLKPGLLHKVINPQIEKTMSSQNLLQYAPKQVAPVRLLAHFGLSCGQTLSIQAHIQPPVIVKVNQNL